MWQLFSDYGWNWAAEVLDVFLPFWLLFQLSEVALPRNDFTFKKHSTLNQDDTSFLG